MRMPSPSKAIKSLKILNVFMVIVVLAFTVRLVDFVSGVSSVVQQAQASATSEPKVEKESDDAVLKVAELDEENLGASNAEHGDSEGKDGKLEVEIPEWSDPSDEDVGYDEIRMDLFKDMSKRREELDDREARLNTREALLKASEKELDQKYRELTQLRGEIEKLLEEQSEEELKRIKSLVKIYEGMKPADAARIFNTLDLDVLVSVLSRMSERKLSGILAQMNPERARTVTIILAEQSKLPELPE